MVGYAWEFAVKDENERVLAHGYGRADFKRQFLNLPNPGEDGVGWTWMTRWWKTWGIQMELPA